MYKEFNEIEIYPVMTNATQRIRNMIIGGEIPSGQRVDQRKIAKHLNITTSPVREAFRVLESEGLLSRIPGVGVFCKTYTVDEIEQLLSIREVMEGLSARYAEIGRAHV